MTPETSNAPDSPASPPEIPPDPPIENRRSGLVRHEAGVLGALLAVLIGTQAYQQWTPDPPAESLSIARGESSSSLPALDWDAPPPEPRIQPRDLNTADHGQLMRIPGIGPALSEQIIRYREQHGPFPSFESLDAVPGIGPKKLESFREYLYVDHPNTSPAVQSLLTSRQSAGKINLNQATQAELETLPGIGEVYARNILAARDRLGGFKSWNDLLEVPGIGAKRLENIKQHATLP